MSHISARTRILVGAALAAAWAQACSEVIEVPSHTTTSSSAVGGGGATTTSSGTTLSTGGTGGAGGSPVGPCDTLHVWRTLGGPGWQEVNDIVVDAGGNAILVGHFRDVADLGAGPIAAPGISWFVAELDAGGALAWHKRLTTNPSPSAPDGISIDVQRAGAVVTDAAGNVTLAQLPAVAGADLGTGPLAEPEASLVKLGPDGSGLWSASLAIPSGGYGYVDAVAVAPGGGIVVGGHYRGDVTVGPSLLADDSRGFLAAFQPDGSAAWGWELGHIDPAAGPSGTVPGQVIFRGDGTIVVPASYEGSVDYGFGPLPWTACSYAYGGSPCLLYKREPVLLGVAPSGEVLWQDAVSPTSSVAVAADGGYLRFHANAIERYDSTGALRWSRPYVWSEAMAGIRHVAGAADGSAWTLGSTWSGAVLDGTPVPAGWFWEHLGADGAVLCRGSLGAVPMEWARWVAGADGSMTLAATVTGSFELGGSSVAVADGMGEILLARPGP